MGSKFVFLSSIFALLLMSGCSNKSEIDTSAAQAKIAKEKANAEKLAKEKADKLKADAERVAKEKADELARKKAETERKAREEAERVVSEQQAKVEKLKAEKMESVASAKNSISNIKNTPISVGSADLSSKMQDELDVVAVFLKKYPNSSVEINSYTDSTGSELFNLELSQKRADVAKEYLLNKDVSAEQVIAIGNGATNFVNLEDTTSSENRRIELELYSN